MELTNEFEVAVPVERAWAILTDLERIAPCLPGAQLREVQGEEYRGSVKVKVGPITTSYDGVIRISELDHSAHRAVLRAEGRETRGQGNVAAVITATMLSTRAGTKVVVATDLTITGKVAQFGRGVLADVSAKLLDQFVVNLESMVLVQEDGYSSTSKESPKVSGAGDAVSTRKRSSKSKAELNSAQRGPENATEQRASIAGAEGAEGSASEIRKIYSEPAEPVDLVDIAKGSVARRVLRPLAITGVALAVVVHLVRRRHR
jgi:hypothetical protein